jgi:hypothetical protein
MFIILGILLVMPQWSFAFDARDYVPLPPDTFLLALYYNQSWGEDYISNGDKTLSDADLETNVTLIRPIYYTEIFGITADPQFILPVGKVEILDDQSSGIGDLILASTFWVINNKTDNYFFAYTPYVTLPTGAYDHDKAINMGANRYSTKQELCFGLGSGDGLWWEIAGSGEFFSDNDDFGSSGATQKKDPVYSAETHLSYDIMKDLFVSIDYYYKYGGETTVDGANQNDSLSTHTVGVSGAYMITPRTQFLLNVARDVSIRNGVRSTSAEARLAFVF